MPERHRPEELSIERLDIKMGVLFEEMRGKLSLLIEGYTGLDGRLVRIEERMERLEKRTDEGFIEMDYKFEHVFGKLDAIEGRLDRHQVPRF